MKQKKWLYAAGALLAVFVIYGVVTYNGLVKKQEAADKYWADVERTYQRRAELIPVLVQTVKGMAGFEKETLERITAARAKLESVQLNGTRSASVQEQEALQKEVAVNANRLIAVIESYPNLRGTEGFLGLQTQMEGTERRIRVARQDYNEAVNKYNVTVRTFPSSLIAGITGFKIRQGFAADPGSEKAIEIKFNQ